MNQPLSARLEAALERLESAIERDPRSPATLAALDRVESLRAEGQRAASGTPAHAVDSTHG